MKPFLLAILCILAVACGTETNQQAPVTANFYLRYLAEGQDINAQATFLERDSSGQQQPVDMPGGVTFQGSGMGKREVGNVLIRYQYENAGQFPQDFRFGCRRSPQDDWTEFSYSMIPIRRFALDDTIQVDEGSTLVLPDGPLTAEEQLVLIFNDVNSQAASLEIKGPTEGNAIRLSAEQLKTLHPGDYQYYLVKKGFTTQSADGFTAHIETEFYSTVAEIFVLSNEE